MMADIFSYLAGQVLGASPEVVPLLPSRFASWPGLPPVDVTPQQQAFTGLLEPGVDASFFQPPLVAPGHPAIETPLPTFHQMSGYRSLHPVQPDRVTVPQDSLETTSFEHDSNRQAMPIPVRPAKETGLPDTPQALSPPASVLPAASPTLAVQAHADGHLNDAVITSSDSPMESGDRPSIELDPKESDRSLPPPLITAPASALQRASQPATGQEHSSTSPGPITGISESLQFPRVEHIGEQPELLKVQPARIGQVPVPAESPPAPVARPFEAVTGQLERFEPQPAPVAQPPEPVKSHLEFIEPSPRPVSRKPEHNEDHTETVKAQGETAKDHPKPIQAHETEISVQPASGRTVPGPLTVHPAAPAQAPDMEPVAPLALQSAPATELFHPVSIQAGDPSTTVAPTPLNGSLEPTPYVGRASPDLREPVIVPALESYPVGYGSRSTEENNPFIPPPLEQPTAGEPESIPTVRVTIGRVVVRASPAAERPPSRRIELPRPPLSLDEYLKGRKDGER